ETSTPLVTQTIPSRCQGDTLTILQALSHQTALLSPMVHMEDTPDTDLLLVVVMAKGTDTGTGTGMGMGTGMDMDMDKHMDMNMDMDMDMDTSISTSMVTSMQSVTRKERTVTGPPAAPAAVTLTDDLHLPTIYYNQHFTAYTCTVCKHLYISTNSIQMNDQNLLQEN
ncbi:hypothetical protein INR49_026802, partial [Caranx melampygus]